MSHKRKPKRKIIENVHSILEEHKLCVEWKLTKEECDFKFLDNEERIGEAILCCYWEYARESHFMRYYRYLNFYGKKEVTEPILKEIKLAGFEIPYDTFIRYTPLAIIQDATKDFRPWHEIPRNIINKALIWPNDQDMPIKTYDASTQVTKSLHGGLVILVPDINITYQTRDEIDNQVDKAITEYTKEHALKGYIINKQKSGDSHSKALTALTYLGRLRGQFLKKTLSATEVTNIRKRVKARFNTAYMFLANSPLIHEWPEND